jgi:hypothetical protein
MSKDRQCGRREFLRRGLTGGLTAMAALSLKEARAQDFPKADKASAGYQDKADANTCDQCSLFLPPDDCKVVQGPVSPSGTCIYFNA